MKSAFNWVGSTYKKWLVESKKSRVLKLYEKKDYVEMVRLFTSQKDYAAVTFDEFPFLYFMISEGNKEGVSCFLQKASFKDNLLFDDNNPLKCNALAYAYLQNKREVAQVLESFGFNLGVANSQGQNILHLAAIYKRKQAFLQGLSQKVNINQVDQYGNTPLHYGCRAGEPEIVESLVAGKALKLQNSIHLYPIHMAIESNSPRIVQLLRDDLWGNYPLFHPMHSAARVGACEIMRQLLKRDPILANVRDYRKMTPLHHAVATESEESVEFLLRQNDILVNCTDEFGNTPLHIAFVREHLESVKKLVESKADLQIENEDHLAPVDLGLDSLSPQMKSYLRSIEHKSSRLRDFGTRI